jgi:fucose 4-O-acetylase-like acetyltransferase
MEPGSRDRFIDLLRGGSIVAVVVGHWLVADVRWADGEAAGGRLVETSSLHEVPAMWPLTWLFVVIPLFFFVGGYANRRSWEGTRRRGEGYATFVDRRVHRVLVPAGLYIAVVAVLGLLLDRAGGVGVRALGGLFYQPLWFLGAYLCVVALTPLTLRLHARFGVGVIAGLLVLVALLDTGRFALDVAAAGYLNVLVVWLLLHQLGYLQVDGRLTRGVAVGMALGGLGMTAVLVVAGPYTASMVGVTDGPVGNMHPPTLAITALGIAQVGVALVLRDPLTRWLQRPRVWRCVVVVNLSVVSIYLWHQAALTVAARLVLPLGYPDPAPGTMWWWVARLLWLVVPGVVLAGIVALVGPAERVGAPTPVRPGRGTAATAVAGVVLVCVGFLALAGSSATEPFDPGQSLGPVTASPMLGLSGIAAAALVFWALRRIAPGAAVGGGSGGPGQDQQGSVVGRGRH